MEEVMLSIIEAKLTLLHEEFVDVFGAAGVVTFQSLVNRRDEIVDARRILEWISLTRWDINAIERLFTATKMDWKTIMSLANLCWDCIRDERSK